MPRLRDLLWLLLVSLSLLWSGPGHHANCHAGGHGRAGGFWEGHAAHANVAASGRERARATSETTSEASAAEPTPDDSALTEARPLRAPRECALCNLQTTTPDRQEPRPLPSSGSTRELVREPHQPLLADLGSPRAPRGPPTRFLHLTLSASQLSS